MNRPLETLSTYKRGYVLLLAVILAAGAFGITGSRAHAQATCTRTGVLGTAPRGETTGTFPNRLTRGGVVGTCGANTFPGNFATVGPYIYNTHRINNTTAAPVCITVSLTINVEGTATSNVQVAAFRAPFAPGDITNAARYLGDPGTSSGSPPTVTTFQVTVPANTGIDLVVFSANPSPASQGTQYTLNITGLACGPTAAGVDVAGRILSSEGGRGVTNARVSLTDASGNSRVVSSMRTGAFRFEDLTPGSYVISIISRRYTFEPKVIEVQDNLTGLDFYPSK